jgi:hypothetical protein
MRVYIEMQTFNYLYGLLHLTSVHCPTNLAGKLQSEYVKYDFIKAHYWWKKNPLQKHLNHCTFILLGLLETRSELINHQYGFV